MKRYLKRKIRCPRCGKKHLRQMTARYRRTLVDLYYREVVPWAKAQEAAKIKEASR